MSEINIQNEIRIALSKYGKVFRINVGVFKTADGRFINSGVPPGFSDLLFVGNGFVAFIEVKTKTGRATAEQLKFLDMMKSLGHKTGIARSVEDALKIINMEVK